MKKESQQAGKSIIQAESKIILELRSKFMP